jgi:VIT1/CCC1 family predicted Fe2+/Mn2+ transporter
MSNKIQKEFIKFQQSELDGSEIYKRLANYAKTDKNRAILSEMAKEEYNHYSFIINYTGKNLKPNRCKIFFTTLLCRILGLTFVLKMMERDEGMTSNIYLQYPQLEAFSSTEDEHEEKLLDMIDETRLKYMGSVVLGLNDALVEFTGALAGFTLALNNTGLIALTGSITGIAGALSMSSSEYFSNKAEGGDKHPLRAAIYTGLSFLITVLALISPFIWISTPIFALMVMIIIAILIIAIFNFYYAVVRGETFRKRFGEMAIISFSIAGLSFIIGYLLKLFTGIEA